MLHLRCSLCRRHLRNIALPPSLRDSVCLICKSFSLSLHISDKALFYRHECQLCWKKPTRSYIHLYYSLAPNRLLFYYRACYLPLQQAYQSTSRKIKPPSTPFLCVKFTPQRQRNILTKSSKKRWGNRLKASSFNASITLLLSSSCKIGFQKVLNWTLKGR